VDEPALLQQDGQSGLNLDGMCSKALQAVLVHDNGQLRQSIYDFLRVRKHLKLQHSKEWHAHSCTQQSVQQQLAGAASAASRQLCASLL
jgi:hypothetical protein